MTAPRSVFVSAGHHPAAPGASHDGFVEHAEAVLWARELAAELGLRAVLVPVGRLTEKVAFINRVARPGDAAVEIHFNAAVNAQGERIGAGSETLYCPASARGRELAEKVQRELGLVFPPSRGVKEGWYRMDSKKGADYFLRATRPVAIIVEPEFVHHRSMIQGFRTEGVRAIARGVLEWLAI